MAVLCPDAPTPQQGWLAAPEGPGLGFDPDPDLIKEFAAKEAV
jgi:L-alanine-DL-glutamate epimerase-like enolase superfamily enzyme